MSDSPFTSPPLEEADADFWRWARRIWHFFRGHPTDVVWVIVEGGMECERCGKEGKRL